MILILPWMAFFIIIKQHKVYFTGKNIFDSILPSLGAMIIILSLYLLFIQMGFPCRSSLQMAGQAVKQCATSFMSDNWLSHAMNCVIIRSIVNSRILSRLLPDMLNTCRLSWKTIKWKLLIEFSKQVWYYLQQILTAPSIQTRSVFGIICDMC